MEGKRSFLWSLGLGLLAVAIPATAEQVTIQITNEASEDGFFLSPIWVGFHDGSFDLFNAGTSLTPGGGMERLAEDGDPTLLQTEFAATGAQRIDGVLVAPEGFPDVTVFEPGEQGTLTFDLDPVRHRYMSFAALVIPSNDAFVGNDDPLTIELFDDAGRFKGLQTFAILGSEVWDAGTEMNTEKNDAFLDHSYPDAGTATSDPVQRHPGLVGSSANPAPGQQPIILGASMDPEVFFDPVACDFTQPGTVVAEIVIIPEPATVVLLTFGGLGLLQTMRRLRAS